jgi:hypothetical protein
MVAKQSTSLKQKEVAGDISTEVGVRIPPPALPKILISPHFRRCFSVWRTKNWYWFSRPVSISQQGLNSRFFHDQYGSESNGTVKEAYLGGVKRS